MARTSKKQQDTQTRWMTKISAAKKVRESWKDLFQVPVIREYIDGKQRPPEYATADWITINNIYSHLKATLPALYANDPYFYVTLKRAFKPVPMLIALWEQRGKMRAAMLNYLKDELRLKEKARLAIQDAQSCYGVVKCHHSSDMRDNPDAGLPMTASNGEVMLNDETGEPLIEPDVIPINSRYHINRVHPDDFMWDEDAGPLEEDWGWLAQRIREPLAEMKNDKRFNKAALKSLAGKGETKGEDEKTRTERKKGGDVAGKTDLMKPAQASGKEPEIVSRWEIYNLKTSTWLVIAEEAGAPLMEERVLPVGIEKHPFAILRFTLRDDSPYPIPPLSPGIDPAKEYNTARSDIQKHRKRFNRKYEAYTQAFEDPDTELSKLESGDDGTILRKRTNEQAVFPIPDAQIDPMRYNELTVLKGEMNELLGLDTGETRQIAKADSATQAGILDRRLEVKEGDALSVVIDFVRLIARKTDQLVQVHIERDEAVKIEGPQGERWELVKTTDYEEVEGEYSYDVNVGATTPRMPQIERASWMAFLTLLAGFPQLLLSKRLFKRMAEMHHIEDEAMLEEIHTIGKQMMSGQLPIPGQQGSQPGQPEDRPTSAMGGMAGGSDSISTGNAAIGA